MKRKVIPVVLLIAAAAVAVTYFPRWWNGEETHAIFLSGNIELTEVDIAFKTAGILVERAVDEGDAVKKGMPIARLDRSQLEPQLERERAGLAATESQLAQLRTSIEFQRETIDGEVQARAAELQQAEARLRELTAGSRPQEIQQAKAAAAAARTEAVRARKDWERAGELFKNDDISASQHDQFRTQFERAEANLKQTEEQLALVIEGPRKENIEVARAQVARAGAAVRLAEAQRIELRRKEQELTMRRAQIEQSKAQVALIESQIADREVTSPIDGVVLVKSANAGETLAAGATVVTVGDIERPWVRGYVNEPDLGRVKLGQKVKVTTDSYPGKIYWGRLSFIASEAEFTPKQIQTPEERAKLVYRIKVDLPNPNHELKSNMPVSGEILLDEHGK